MTDRAVDTNRTAADAADAEEEEEEERWRAAAVGSLTCTPSTFVDTALLTRSIGLIIARRTDAPDGRRAGWKAENGA